MCIRDRDYTDRAVARARGLGEERKVGLEPRLTLSGRKLKLELKVGRERKYMVRDLAAFAEAVERGRTAGYGKGLSFCHSREAFEEASKPVSYTHLDVYKRQPTTRSGG